MSKAKHIHAILRGHNYIIHQLHAPSTLAATAAASVSTTTAAAAASLRLLPSRLVVASSASTAHHGDDRHTSHASDSIQSSSSTGGTGGAGAGTRAKSDGNGASQGAAGQVAGDAGVGRVLEERTSSSSTLSATTGRWTSELPWIDPNTQSSRESGSSGGNSNTTHTNGSNSSSNNTKKTTTASFFDQPFQNTRHNYVFAHGASGFAKNPGKQPTLTPEEDRAYLSVQVGEDSYFRRHDALGVADGVGGWSGTTGK
ncbi:hypothetical protein EDD11_001184 [Mortierella claussenii]|nr:hypothetical protein EDD11_001184 [Mortierella claussenii]